MSKWEEKQLGSVCSEIFSGGTPSTLYPEYWNGEIPWLSSGETSRRYIYNTEKTITELGAQNSSTRLAKNGDIVIACAGQGKTRGQVSTIKRDMYINQSVIAIRGDSKNADTDFIYYNLLLRYDELRYLSDASSTRGSITTEMLKKLKIILPDLPTQQRIADILSAYDDLIENNNKRIALLQKAAQELYKEWFVRFRFPGHETTRFVNGLPEGWEYIRLGKAIEIIDGDRGTNYPKQEEFYGEGHCLFLNAGNVTKTGFDFSAVSFITEEKDKLLRKGKLKRGDVVLTTRGTVGNSAFYNDFVPFKHIRINSGMVILRDLGCVSPEYVYCLLNSSYMLKSMELYASGSAQPQLPIKDMRRIKVINPDDGTMRTFTEKVQKQYNLIALLVSKNQNLAKQRDLLLPRLMSGKLEV
jgi:type I restriction enzyme S subunit